MNDLTNAEREKFAKLIRSHVSLGARFSPGPGCVGFVFGSLCGAAGIDEDEFAQLLDQATDLSDAQKATVARLRKLHAEYNAALANIVKDPGSYKDAWNRLAAEAIRALPLLLDALEGKAAGPEGLAPAF